MLWLVLSSIWVCLLIMVFYDIFRSRDLAGWGKVLLTLAVIIIPLLGVLIYLIAHMTTSRPSVCERYRPTAGSRCTDRSVARSPTDAPLTPRGRR